MKKEMKLTLTEEETRNITKARLILLDLENALGNDDIITINDEDWTLDEIMQTTALFTDLMCQQQEVMEVKKK